MKPNFSNNPCAGLFRAKVSVKRTWILCSSANLTAKSNNSVAAPLYCCDKQVYE